MAGRTLINIRMKLTTMIHVSQLNQVAEGKKKRMKPKQSELTDEEPSPAEIFSCDWRSGGVSFCTTVAESVRIENSKMTGWPGGGQKDEGDVARVSRLRLAYSRFTTKSSSRRKEKTNEAEAE